MNWPNNIYRTDCELKRMDEEQEVDYYHALIEFYTLLAKVYEKQEL